MRLLLFSDPHITPKAEFSKPTDDGLTEYLHRLQESFAWICSRIETWRPDYVCCLGDVFESTGFVDTVSLKMAHELCGLLSRYVKDVDARCLFLVGNHDSYSVEHNQHNLHFLKRYGITVVDKPTFIDGIFCIPWTDQELPKPPVSAKICLSHIDVKGGALYKDYRADFGYDPDDLPCMTFNGHQHNPCEVWPHFYNIGALMSRSFSDADSPPRGVTIYDTDNNKLVFEVNPHDVPFKDVRIDSPAAAKLWAEKIDNAETGLDNACVRLRYDEDYAQVAEQLSYVTMGTRLEPLPRNLVEATSEHVNETFSPEDNFRQYVEQVFLFDDEGDRERILELGLGYIKQVRSSDRLHTLPIKFRHVHAQGFQSLGDVYIDLEMPGLVYIEGPNGVGKSSIVEAIYWCLTGESMRGYRGDDVINWEREWCSVEVNLEIGGQVYIVERYRKHPTNKNKVILGMYADDGPTDISCRVTKDTDAKVQELLGRSKDVLRHSVFLSGGLETRFTALRFPDRIQLIEQITDSDIYGDIFKLVKTDTAKAVEVVHTGRGRIDVIEKSIANLDKRISEVMGEIVEQRRKQESGLAELKQQLGEAIREQGVCEANVESLSANIEQSTEKRRQLHDALYNDLGSRLNAATQNLSRLDAQRESLKSSLAEKRRYVMEGVCVTCGQSIEGSPLVDQVEGLKAKLRAKIADCEVESNVATELHAEHARRKKEVDELDFQMNVWSDERRAAETKLQSAKELASSVKAAMQKMRGEGVDLEAVRRTLKEDRQRWHDELAQLQTKMIEHDEKHLYAMEWLHDAFSTKGIRAKMLATVTVPYLNERLREHSAWLGLHCQLTTQTETKGGDVQNKVDVILAGKLTYRGCSRGERRKVDFALQCALNDLAIATGGSHVNLLVCDEVIDPLDDASAINVVEMLKVKAEDMKILLMAHKPFLGDRCQTKISLAKEGDVTTLG
jgi:DNA repair exonuclease SbcCD ATPase subunit